MKRPGAIPRLQRAIGLIVALMVSSPVMGGDTRLHGIDLDWRDGTRSIVVGNLRVDRPQDLTSGAPAMYSIEVESVVVGEFRPGQIVPLRAAYATSPTGPGAPLPIGERIACYLARPLSTSFEDGGGRSWTMAGGDIDFMGPDGAPFCRMGPEAEAIIRDAPRMIEITGLGSDLSRSARSALKREAVWEEWRKGEMRRTLVLEWIIFLHDKDPALRAPMLDFLETVVDDRTLPPDCRLMAEFKLASKRSERPEYANQTARRAALLIELLADPNLSEQPRKDAEYVLADLTRRLEAEKAPPAE